MSSIAETEGVGEGDILMFVNDRTIQPHDSPRSLGITVADIVGLSHHFLIAVLFTIIEIFHPGS